MLTKSWECRKFKQHRYSTVSIYCKVKINFKMNLTCSTAHAFEQLFISRKICKENERRGRKDNTMVQKRIKQ
jgi:hypothetical protein